MSSLRNLLSLSALGLIAGLGSCKDINGNAIITVTDVSTGANLGCLNTQQVQNIPTAQCHHFFTKGGKEGGKEGKLLSGSMTDPHAALN